MPTGPLLILDRDGVINQDSEDYIRSASAWRPLPGSIEALVRLSRGGFRIAVATNQSGLARGLFDGQALDAMHDKLRAMVAERGGRLDCVAHCPHWPHAGCACRKPATGMFDAIATALGATLVGAIMVGDSEKDLLAARARGCLPVLVRTGNGRRTETQIAPDPSWRSLRVFDDLGGGRRDPAVQGMDRMSPSMPRQHPPFIVLALRSAVFYCGFLALGAWFGATALLTVPLRPVAPAWHRRYVLKSLRFSTLWLQFVCKIRYRVVGAENLPDVPCVLLCQHQSTWDACAVPTLCEPMTISIVIKRELLRIPIFGWGLALVHPHCDRPRPPSRRPAQDHGGRHATAAARLVGARVPGGHTAAARHGGAPFQWRRGIGGCQQGPCRADRAQCR